MDECHNFLNLAYPLEDMLAEARGYRLSMTLAHQYLGQLPKELEEGISTNARSKIFFNASPEDAKRLARHTLPRLVDHDLSNLGAFHVAARLVLRGEEAPSFTAVTDKLPPAIPGRAKVIRAAAKINTRQPVTTDPTAAQARASRRPTSRRLNRVTHCTERYPHMVTNSTSQRELRGHMPPRPTPRAATTGAHHAQLAGRLTLRDRWLARMLHEHRVFTTQQIVDLCYPTLRAANHRLLDLYKWRFVDRFQPFVTIGTAPMHYVLDIAGAVALAYEDGLDPKQLRYRHEDAIGIAHSLRLAHTIGVNGFFTPLVELSRLPDARGRLTGWWSERRCARLFGDIVRPDAYGRWREDGREVEFFLEFDFGTENLDILASKLHGYDRLATTTGIATPILVWLPTNRRETTARRALAEAHAQLDHPELVPIATTAADVAAVAGENNAAAARWLPINPTSPGSGRLRLSDLARIWPYLETPSSARPAPVSSQPAPVLLAPPEPLPPPTTVSRFRR